ncbi:hypothetical protein H312_03011 [Anncaliia algerae PRA339]|uniref:Uncharacterized protein n=1 Tax=Anncaliia algerae PRA339 TaxID=1288291 RepID=A0A059EY01_9MICR|nr:hypothetical protein H312_03011 [Anncaliia algerae PRA339]
MIYIFLFRFLPKLNPIIKVFAVLRAKFCSLRSLNSGNKLVNELKQAIATDSRFSFQFVRIFLEI